MLLLDGLHSVVLQLKVEDFKLLCKLVDNNFDLLALVGHVVLNLCLYIVSLEHQALLDLLQSSYLKLCLVA